MMSLLDPAGAALARPILRALMDDGALVVSSYDSRGRCAVAALRRRILYSGQGTTLAEALADLDAQMRAFPHGAPREVLA